MSAAPKTRGLSSKKMYELVDEAEAVLTDKERDLDDFGRLLDTTWRLKIGTGSSISTNSIDGLYEKGNCSRYTRWKASRCWWRWIPRILRSAGETESCERSNEGTYVHPIQI